MGTPGSARRLEETSATLVARRDRALLAAGGERQRHRQELWLARALLAAAVLIAGYLAYFSLSGAALPGCRPEDVCGDVLASSWGNWFGVPVSLPAVGIYLALLAASFGVDRRVRSVTRRRLWSASVALGSTILVAAVWFTGLQMLALEQWCMWCTATHLLASGSGGIMIHRARVATRSGQRVLAAKELGWFAAGAAAIGWVVLAAGQVTSALPAAAASVSAARAARYLRSPLN